MSIHVSAVNILKKEKGREKINDIPTIFTDRDFNIADLLDARSVTLNIPPKLSDPSGQLSESDCVTTHRIASVHIHVERAIGRVKNLRIMESIPNTYHA